MFELALRSQGSVQKLIFLPFPRWNFADALKSALTRSSVGSGKPGHGFSGWVHVCQSHLILSVVLCASTLVMPSPPSSRGLHTALQFTKHFPPGATSLLSQRNHLRTLSTALRSQTGGSMEIIWKTSMAERTCCTRLSRASMEK